MARLDAERLTSIPCNLYVLVLQVPQSAPEHDPIKHRPDRHQLALVAALGRQSFPFGATPANGDCGVCAPLQAYLLREGFTPEQAEEMACRDVGTLRRAMADLLRPPNELDAIVQVLKKVNPEWASIPVMGNKSQLKVTHVTSLGELATIVAPIAKNGKILSNSL
jgi:hypothetical protein